MNKLHIKEFKCMICGKKFTELTPVHEKLCMCIDCYQTAEHETFGKGNEILTLKKLKKIVKEQNQ